MTRVNALPRSWWAGILVAFVAAGCGEGGSSTQTKAEADFAKGRRFAEARRYSEAIVACQQALEADSNHVEARLLLG